MPRDIPTGSTPTDWTVSTINDPFWQKCVELGVVPTFHSVGYGWGWGSRTSISNYVHNHIGNFAASAEAVCKGLFLGGVPARFPTLRFAFLEGGAVWARIGSAQDIRDLFAERFFFGCEGDDPLNMVAFDPMGTSFETRLRAFYGSDIGHLGCAGDAGSSGRSACELVENRLMNEDQLREFLFADPVELWTSTNPNFFKGTLVESEVDKLLSGQRKRQNQPLTRVG